VPGEASQDRHESQLQETTAEPRQTLKTCRHIADRSAPKYLIVELSCHI
jgi:hypothetical protein